MCLKSKYRSHIIVNRDKNFRMEDRKEPTLYIRHDISISRIREISWLPTPRAPRGETYPSGRDLPWNSHLKFLLARVLRPRPRIPFTDWIWHQLFIATSRRRERERERERERRARAAVINTADFPSVCCCIWKLSTGLLLHPPPPPPPLSNRLDLSSSLPLHCSRTSMLDRRTINKKADHPRNSLVYKTLPTIGGGFGWTWKRILLTLRMRKSYVITTSALRHVEIPQRFGPRFPTKALLS